MRPEILIEDHAYELDSGALDQAIDHARHICAREKQKRQKLSEAEAILPKLGLRTCCRSDVLCAPHTHTFRSWAGDPALAIGIVGAFLLDSALAKFESERFIGAVCVVVLVASLWGVLILAAVRRIRLA